MIYCVRNSPISTSLVKIQYKLLPFFQTQPIHNKYQIYGKLHKDNQAFAPSFGVEIYIFNYAKTKRLILSTFLVTACYYHSGFDYNSEK